MNVEQLTKIKHQLGTTRMAATTAVKTPSVSESTKRYGTYTRVAHVPNSVRKLIQEAFEIEKNAKAVSIWMLDDHNVDISVAMINAIVHKKIVTNTPAQLEGTMAPEPVEYTELMMEEASSIAIKCKIVEDRKRKFTESHGVSYSDVVQYMAMRY